MIANWCGKDKFNKRGERTLNNTNRYDFNCGGYALETFNWYQPFKDEEARRLFGWRTNISSSEILEVTVKHMLKDFKGKLRVIKRVEELKENEYAIAYRVGKEDFHYAKRNSKGVWFHKTGRKPIIKRMTKEQLFESEWKGGYNSEIILFAKRK